jgi:hypothetical protein
MDMIHYPWVAEYLHRHGGEFARVLMFHAYDCYFSRDPFEIVGFDAMGFVDDGSRFENADQAAGWIAECVGPGAVPEVANRTVINSGVIFGPAKLFVEFEKLLLTPEYWANCRLDWPIIDMIVANDALQKAGIRYHVLSCNGPVLTVPACKWGVLALNGVQEVTSKVGVFPHIVHQWAGVAELSDLFRRKCDLTDYIRGVEKGKGVQLNWSVPVTSD